MSDEYGEGAQDLATQIQAEIPIWPNLPDVPTNQRCRAWCLSTALDAIPIMAKGDPAANAVKAASVFEDYILNGTKKGPKLETV